MFEILEYLMSEMVRVTSHRNEDLGPAPSSRVSEVAAQNNISPDKRIL